MKTKIFLILRALLLIGGIFALQGCFEEEYRGYEPGYAYAPDHRYRYESPRHEWEEEEHEEHEGRDRD